MYVKVCNKDELWEGGAVMGAAAGHRIIVVWPTGGEPLALHGICPHRGVPLDGADLKGTALTCPQHLWTFDCLTGESLDPPGSALARYPMKIEDGAVFVDTEGVTPVMSDV